MRLKPVMLTIAVDAMGGDHAPKSEVEGAIRGRKSFGCQRDSGRSARTFFSRELAQHPGRRDLPIEIHHASEFVTMEDSAAKAFGPRGTAPFAWPPAWCGRAVAQGVVSAGNTGAVMATAKIVQGVIPGRGAPGAGSAFPTLNGSPVVLVDVGANVDCKPQMLAQFAVMGRDLFARDFSQAEPARRHCFPSARKSTRATS